MPSDTPSEASVVEPPAAVAITPSADPVALDASVPVRLASSELTAIARDKRVIAKVLLYGVLGYQHKAPTRRLRRDLRLITYVRGVVGPRNVQGTRP